MGNWKYNAKTKTYIDPDGNELSQASLGEVREDYIESTTIIISDYAANLESGAWTVGTFETEMRKRIKNAYVANYVLGRGGANAMTPADYGRVGAMLRRQYGFLRSYLDDITAGRESPGTATQRGRQYLGSARQAFSRGRAHAFGIDLPYHPGDGGTPCHGNCRCHWEIEETAEEYRAYWRISSVKTCGGCSDRAAESSPFVQRKVETTV